MPASGVLLIPNCCLLMKLSARFAVARVLGAAWSVSGACSGAGGAAFCKLDGV